MRDINVIAEAVTELANSVAWDQAASDNGSPVDFPMDESAWKWVSATGLIAYCWDGIQATLCPLGLVQLDPTDYPPGSLALVADGYVYVLHSAEELHAVQHQDME